jgi:hypothetical protein
MSTASCGHSLDNEYTGYRHNSSMIPHNLGRLHWLQYSWKAGVCYNTYQVRTYLQIHELGPPIYRVAEGRNFGTCRTMTTIKRVVDREAGSTLSTNVRHDGQIE